MSESRRRLRVRGRVLLCLIGVALCTIASGLGNWLGTMHRNRAPAGFEPTNIPGVFVDHRLADMGMIAPDHVGEITFKLLNGTRRVYTLEDISTDCSCAAVNLNGSTLPPKATLVIPVRMNVAKLTSSTFQKAVAVKLVEDGTGAAYKDVFRFQGEMDRSGTFIAWPGIVDCGTVTAGTTVTKRIYFKADRAILSRLPSKLQVTRFPCNLCIEKIEYENRLDVKPAEVAVVFPPDTPLGSFDSSMTIEIPGSVPRRMGLAIHARIEPSVTSVPRRVLITVVDNSEATATLTIHSSDKTPIAVKDVACSLPIRWSVSQRPEKGHTTTLTISISQGTLIGDAVRRSLRIDLEDGRALVVPLVILRPPYKPTGYPSHQKRADRDSPGEHTRGPNARARPPALWAQTPRARDPPHSSHGLLQASLTNAKQPVK